MTEHLISVDREHEGRVGRLEGIIEQINDRLGNLERGQRWLIGLMLGLSGVQVGLLLKLVAE